MGKRALISIPIIVILLAGIVTSFLLTNQKIEASKISTAERVGAYSKPAVVRIIDAANVQWDYSAVTIPEVYAFIASQKGQTLIGGSGSGAVITSNGYIVTNAHVVELTRKNDQDIATEALKQLSVEVATYFNLSPDTVATYLFQTVRYQGVQRYQKVYLPGNDKPYDSDVKSFGAPVGEGKDVAVLKIDAKNLPTLQLASSENVQLQEDIWVVGYPAAADSEVLSADSQLVSTINGGQISATDKKSSQGNPVLQISAATTHGNSGGPVINKEGKIVGLLTFRGNTVNGSEVQGFNFAVPSATVQEFINQAGAKPEAGTVDTLYKEGLEFYWAGYYKEALDRFQKVQQLYDKQSEVKRLISDSQAKVGQSKIYWAGYKTYFYIYDGVAVLLIIYLVLFAFVFKPKTGPQLALAPEGETEKQGE